MTLSQSTEQNYTIISVSGRLDTVTAPDFDSYVEKNVTAGDTAINLAEVEYLSSAGLRSLLKIGKKTIKEGGEFCIIGASGIVAEVLEESGLDSVLKVKASLSD